MNSSLALFIYTLNSCLEGRGSFTPEEFGPGVMKVGYCFLSRHLYFKFKPCRPGRTIIGVIRKNVFMKTLSETLRLTTVKRGRLYIYRKSARVFGAPPTTIFPYVFSERYTIQKTNGQR